MFEGGERPPPAVSPVGVAALITAVNNLESNGSGATLIEQITLLEHLKSSCAAAQATLTHAFTAQQKADGVARHIPADRTRRSIARQIALARRESRHRGGRLVGLAGALTTETPRLFAALRSGQLSERRADLIVAEFACLTPADRTRADALIGPDLPTLGDRSASARAAVIAARLDPAAVMGKIRGAVKDRHVSSRPAPDTMSRLSALLPVAQGVAVYAALLAAAGTATAAPGGDPRNRGQLMADALVSLVTGQHVTGCDSYGVPTYGPRQEAAAPKKAAANGSYPDAAPEDTSIGTDPSGRADLASACAKPAARSVGLRLNIIMTDRTLFGSDQEPAHLIGHGPIPAPLARALVIGAADTGTRTFLQRLYTDPSNGQLVAMDSRQRLFPAVAQRFLIARDQTCRTPWCDAPIRHIDHVIPHAQGGPTGIDNGQGLCSGCNLTKEEPGWHSSMHDAIVRITTPTGHTYTSHPPAPPSSPPWPQPDVSRLEIGLTEILLDAA